MTSYRLDEKSKGGINNIFQSFGAYVSNMFVSIRYNKKNVVVIEFSLRCSIYYCKNI